MQEARELATESCYEYEAHPLEVSFSSLYHYPPIASYQPCIYTHQDNIFEWHFTVRGPGGTEFEDGR